MAAGLPPGPCSAKAVNLAAHAPYDSDGLSGRPLLHVPSHCTVGQPPFQLYERQQRTGAQNSSSTQRMSRRNGLHTCYACMYTYVVDVKCHVLLKILQLLWRIHPAIRVMELRVMRPDHCARVHGVQAAQRLVRREADGARERRVLGRVRARRGPADVDDCVSVAAREEIHAAGRSEDNLARGLQRVLLLLSIITCMCGGQPSGSWLAAGRGGRVGHADG